MDPGPLQERLRLPLVDNRGSILVLALWAVLILGVFSVSMGYHVRQKISLASRLDRRNSLYSFAEIGVGKALAEIRVPDTNPDFDGLNEMWANHEQVFKDIPVGDGTVNIMYEDPDSDPEKKKIRYGMQDEESKINLNAADPKIMSRLFQIAAELDDDESKEIAYAIVDWRDRSEEHTSELQSQR